MDNRGILTIIAVLLLGIFTVILIQANEESPVEEIGNSFGEAVEEIGDEIDDNTDAS